MREYAKVAPTFWTGETGKALRAHGPEAIVVALYLMTSPMSNMLGIYPQPFLYLAHETGLGVEGARKGLDACQQTGFCRYDESTETVWVIEMAARQIAPNLKASDNRCLGIQRDDDSLPKNPFLADFFRRYAAAFHLRDARGIEGPSKPLPSKEQEKEQEQEQEKDVSPTGLASADADLLGDKPEKLTKEERLAEVTKDAVETFNASPLVKANGGLLSSVSTRVGWDTRRTQVRRCVKTARDICIERLDSQKVTREFWEQYWTALHADDFMSGRGKGGRGHESWKPDFEYFTRKATMLKVYEKAAEE